MSEIRTEDHQLEPDCEAKAAALEAEQAAWFTRPREERQRYAGQYVAVRGGQVVDHDPDQRASFPHADMI
ncbi:MAG: DUF5678 domain-containing protein [Candidatus Methanomethylicaceae archaeon]